jgi:hypothetical protein
MRSYQVTKTIQADPERIWALLTDATAYPSWNSAVDRVEGTIAPGETIKVHVPVNPGRSFPVKVTTFEPAKRMVWTGGMPLGLFKGERTFVLAPGADGTTTFTMQELYTGALAGMMSKQIPDLSGAFEEFGESLKRKAEST